MRLACVALLVAACGGTQAASRTVFELKLWGRNDFDEDDDSSLLRANKDCGGAVRQVVEHFADGHHVNVLDAKHGIDPDHRDRTMIHFADWTSADRFFEVIYVHDPSTYRASLSFNSVTNRGAVMSPEAILDGDDLAAFRRDLIEALRCP